MDFENFFTEFVGSGDERKKLMIALWEIIVY
jgi:hypothetical protein